MEPVNPSASKAVMRSSDTSSSVIIKGSTNTTHVSQTAPNKSIQFTDISTQVDESTANVRPEVLANVKKLMEDPDWLSDSNLENLSSKMLSIEDF